MTMIRRPVVPWAAHVCHLKGDATDDRFTCFLQFNLPGSRGRSPSIDGIRRWFPFWPGLCPQRDRDDSAP